MFLKNKKDEASDLESDAEQEGEVMVDGDDMWEAPGGAGSNADTRGGKERQDATDQLDLKLFEFQRAHKGRKPDFTASESHFSPKDLCAMWGRL